MVAESREYFTARGIETGEAVAWALLLTLGLPAIVLGVEELAGRLRAGARAGVHVGALAVGAAFVAAQVIERVVLEQLDAGDTVPGVVVLLLAITVGLGFAWLVRRTEAARTWLTFLVPAPAIFVVLFALETRGAGEEAAAAEAGRARPVPVVVVVFDELPSLSLMRRDGQLDATRFPGFARLAATSTWYRDATTVNDSTNYALPAIMTGRRPALETRPDARSFPQTLFSLLEPTHVLNVVEPVTQLCSSPACRARDRSFPDALGRLAEDTIRIDLRFSSPDDLRDTLPRVDDTIASAADHDAITAEFLERVAPGDRPSLSFLHLMLPHQPWTRLPDGRRYARSEKTAPFTGFRDPDWVGGRALIDQSRRRHILQVGYADRVLDRVLDRLRATGVLDEAVVVVTADHGVSFDADEPARYVTEANVAAIGSVPLFVKLPRQRSGRVVDGPAETADIVPTIARAVGLPALEGIDGQPLPRAAAGGASRSVDSARGGAAEVEPRAFAAARAEVLRRQSRVVGDGPWEHVYGEVDAAARAAAAGALPANVEVDDVRALERPDGVVPAVVGGRVLDPDAGPGDRLVLTLSGRPVAVAEVAEVGTELRVVAVVDPQRLPRGPLRPEFLRLGTGP